MGKPTLSHMFAYLKRIGVKLKPLTKEGIESEYFRRIYQVHSRDEVLQAIPVKSNHVTRRSR